MQSEYTLEEVAQHNKDGDCWLVIDGNVYDVSNFMNDHPGGGSLLLNASGPGQDASEPFEDAEHSKSAKNQMKTMMIGTIVQEK